MESSFSPLISLISFLSMPTASIFHFRRKVYFYLFISMFSLFTMPTTTLSGKTSSSFFYNKIFIDISKESSANNNKHKGGERHEWYLLCVVVEQSLVVNVEFISEMFFYNLLKVLVFFMTCLEKLNMLLRLQFFLAIFKMWICYKPKWWINEIISISIPRSMR